MTTLNLLGYFLISLPFIGLLVFAVRTIGWRGALTVILIVASVLLLITAGVDLTRL